MASLVFVAHSHDDPTGDPIGTVTGAFDKRVTVEADGIGSGELSINGHDMQSAWTAPGNYIAVYRDTVSGDPIAGFWIADGSDVILSSDEEGGEIFRRTGPGPIMVLDEAIVWHRAYRGGSARIQRRQGRWVFSGSNFQIAEVLLRMLREAKARGCIPFVTWTFSRREDSDGNRWPEDTQVDRYTVPIGITLTELVTMLRAKGLRIEMDAAFRINVWPEERVNDLSGSVELAAGTDIREEVTRQVRASRMKSTALVGGERHRGGERFLAVTRSDFRAQLGRRVEGFRDLGRVASRRALRRTGRRSLRRWKRLKDGPASVPVIDTTGQVALVDYMPGDTVTLTIPGAYSNTQVIDAITLAETESGEYDPILEFGGLTPDRGEDFSDDAATAARG